MYQRGSKTILALVILLTLVACSTTTVMPQANGTTKIVTTAATNREATKLAITKAHKICNVFAQAVKIVDLKASKQEFTPAQHQLITRATAILPPVKSKPPYFPPKQRWQTTLIFGCQN